MGYPKEKDCENRGLDEGMVYRMFQKGNWNKIVRI
jgi:hypothetical protein